MLLFLNLGGGEIFVILLITLLFFGSKRIPEVAKTLGKAIRQMKDASGAIQRDIQDTTRDMKRDLNVKKHLEDEIKDSLK
ncbi:MAG: sec-independent protein translocase protein TatA [Flavobacteriales bacterium]|jgi:sec-independent protein translocase protein TatA